MNLKQSFLPISTKIGNDVENQFHLIMLMLVSKKPKTFITLNYELYYELCSWTLLSNC